MSQVLSNLIGNALEYGSVQANANVDVHGDENTVTIAIHNRGSTIPPDELNGIFNPMKRKRVSAGSAGGAAGNLGLGLYIADQIVHSHKGSIGVESSEADGTTFTVRVPRRG
jgi:signal transduction histidine kinase